jgi:DNA-directed RNA polymerase subunit RPC12/RpoP
MSLCHLIVTYDYGTGFFILSLDSYECENEEDNLKTILQKNLTQNEPKTPRRRYLCPLCSKQTVLWLLPDTEIKNLPVKCKRCGREIIVNVSPLSET